MRLRLTTSYIKDCWWWEPRYGTRMHRYPCWLMRIRKRQRRERSGEPEVLNDR